MQGTNILFPYFKLHLCAVYCYTNCPASIIHNYELYSSINILLHRKMAGYIKSAIPFRSDVLHVYYDINITQLYIQNIYHYTIKWIFIPMSFIQIKSNQTLFGNRHTCTIIYIYIQSICK